MASSSRFCLGCGLDLETAKSYERRVLCSETTKKILPAWDEIVGRKLKQLNLQIDRDEVIGCVDDSCTSSLQKPGYMCRKCVRLYEQYQKQQQDLLTKAENALSVMPGVSPLIIASPAPGQKRQREADSEDVSAPPKAKRPLFTQGSKSPGVVVRDF